MYVQFYLLQTLKLLAGNFLARRESFGSDVQKQNYFGGGGVGNFGLEHSSSLFKAKHL
jgi:hypothetical protein